MSNADVRSVDLSLHGGVRANMFPTAACTFGSMANDGDVPPVDSERSTSSDAISRSRRCSKRSRIFALATRRCAPPRPLPRGAAARDEGPTRPSGRPEREAVLHAARGTRAHRHAARRGRQAVAAAIGVRHRRRQERRRHGRHPHERPQDARRAPSRHRSRDCSTGAPRSCSTRASTSCWPATRRSPARSSRSRR